MRCKTAEDATGRSGAALAANNPPCYRLAPYDLAVLGSAIDAVRSRFPRGGLEMDLRQPPVMMIDTPALDIADVSHRFGSRQALSHVSLRVGRGDFTALLGPNGAGKTTLFAIITRLYNNRAGLVRIFGRDLQREPSAALAEMGVVFQKPTLDSDLTVRQNLAYHAALHGMSGRRARQRIAELLERVGLSDRAKDKVRTLSGGQSRRIEIARSLVHRPRLLLLDEATVGLDLASRTDIVRIVRELVRDEGLSVLWSTHIFDEIEPNDSVYVLHAGKILTEGLSREISAKAAGASLADAFRAMTKDTTREELVTS